MSLVSPRAGRFGARLTAGAAAGLVAAAMFAAPARAEIPGISGDPTAALTLDPAVSAGAAAPGSIGVEYTPVGGQEDTTHAVVAELLLDGSAGVLELTSDDDACEVAGYRITCAADAGPSSAFAFAVTAASSAESERFPYTFTATVDGVAVAETSGTLDVEATYDVHNPYAHGDVAVTDAVEDTSVEFNPVFYQDFDLAPTAAAVVVTFSDPVPGDGIDPSGLAAVIDYFGNCRTTFDDAAPTLTRTGMECVVTDFPDLKGQFLTLTSVIDYRIANGVVGPLDVCSCTYSVKTVNAAVLAEEYDGGSWVTGSSMLGLTAASEGWEGGEDSIAYFSGDVVITTADNTYDLEVQETVIEGMVGDTVTVTTEVANNGPGATDDLNPEGNSYLLRAQLPEGVELVRVDSDGGGLWECYGAGELDAVYAETPGTLLERFDFACALDDFGFNETPDLVFTVELTGTTAFQGAIEVGAVYGDGRYEGDASSDFALVYNDAEAARFDYDQDDYEDLLVIHRSDGKLRFYAGTADGTYASAVNVGTGWGKMDIVMAGDLTGDGVPDFVARDNRTGILYTYRGDGEGGHGSRITIGTGWNGMGQIAVGNFDGDAHPDILATAYADGNMYYYPGLGGGKFGDRVLWGEFWDGMDVISSVGDLDDDGFDEYLSRWNYDGQYYLYTSTGEVVVLDESLYVGDDSRRFDQVVGVGDLTRDGRPDIVAPDLGSGDLVRYTIDPEWPGYNQGTVIGNGGWNGVRLPVIQLDRTEDFDYDGYSDFFAQRRSTGDLFLYEGTGTGHGDRWNLCEDCDGITAAAAGGDYNSDGRTDLVYRVYTGELITAPGIEGGTGFTTEISVGSGWNSMDLISGGYDYDSDGRDDLIARKPSSGYLYLYPGRGDGTFESRIAIGGGWNSMREVVAAGDLDTDGNADLLALKKSDGCLYLYRGHGDGVFDPRVRVGCGWSGYDQITAVGDFDRDGHCDWLARRKSDGDLFLYRGTGTGDDGSRILIGTAWNSMGDIA